MPGKPWSPEKNAWFDEYAKDHLWREVSEEHERLYGSPLTRTQVLNRRQYRGIKCSKIGGRFEKGSIPATAQQVPVGTERISKDGYVEVKVSERAVNSNGSFRRKHVIVWEKAHGKPVPKGHTVVFADKDKMNFDLDNLVLVSLADFRRIANMGYPYCDRKTLETCINVSKLQGAVSKVDNPVRPCKVCGKPTKFKEKRLRTCRECLDRRKGRK